MTDHAPFAPPRSRTPLRVELEKIERVTSGCLWALTLIGQPLIALFFAQWAGLGAIEPTLALAFAVAFAITTLLSPLLLWRTARIRMADVRGPMEALVAASGAQAWWPSWLHPARTPHVSGVKDDVRWVVRFPSGRNTLAKPVMRDRVAVFVEQPAPLLLTVTPKDVVGALDRWASRAVESGDPALDEAYLVAAEEVGPLRALLAAPGVRPALDIVLAVHPRFRLQTSAIGIWWWCPDEVEPTTILAARDALLGFASALDGARAAAVAPVVMAP